MRMNKNLSIIVLVVVSLSCFLLLKTPIGTLIFMPIEILVAFLHEFGHASMAVITGGRVDSLQVNPDGSGVTGTAGGSEALITMGGYIGSCFFSNMLVRASLTRYAKTCSFALSLAMVFSALAWFSTLSNLIILFVYAGIFFVLSSLSLSSILLQFIGIACSVRVLQDFDIGPSSDLHAFQSYVGILPYTGWMYVWLAIAIFITYLNIKEILSSEEYNETRLH